MFSKGYCSQTQDNPTPGNVSGHVPDNSSCMQQTPPFDVPVVNTREKKQSTPLPNFELTQFMIDLETKLLQSLRELIQHAVESLREHIEVELHGFKKEIETLNSRVTELEEITVKRDENLGDRRQIAHKQSITEEHTNESLNVNASSVDFEDQITQISQMVKAQQQTIEKGEREKRGKNVIIIGINEGEQHTEKIVKDLLEGKLGITPPPIQYCRRLGQRNQTRSRPRPILVAFETVEGKKSVMRKKSRLAGTSIYINDDLTKDQQLHERHMRNRRKELLKQP